MMDQLRLPSYYTILPASVRYDMDLSFFEMVLYSEIIALATVTGYCHASNGYFSMLYKKDERVISRSISKLQARGHVRLLIENGFDRRIYILTSPLLENKRPYLVNSEQTTPDNSVYPPPTKMTRGRLRIMRAQMLLTKKDLTKPNKIYPLPPMRSVSKRIRCSALI